MTRPAAGHPARSRRPLHPLLRALRPARPEAARHVAASGSQHAGRPPAR